MCDVRMRWMLITTPTQQFNLKRPCATVCLEEDSGCDGHQGGEQGGGGAGAAGGGADADGVHAAVEGGAGVVEADI